MSMPATARSLPSSSKENRGAAVQEYMRLCNTISVVGTRMTYASTTATILHSFICSADSDQKRLFEYPSCDSCGRFDLGRGLQDSWFDSRWSANACPLASFTAHVFCIALLKPLLSVDFVVSRQFICFQHAIAPERPKRQRKSRGISMPVHQRHGPLSSPCGSSHWGAAARHAGRRAVLTSRF